MKFCILTIFPEGFSYLKQSILQKAQETWIIEIEIVNIRDFSMNKYKKVDSIPYWGWQGMVMTCQPLWDAIDHIKNKNPNTKIINLSPRWKILTQNRLRKLSLCEETIVLICWRYEWIDQRIIDLYVDEEISIWKYVLSSWELPAQILIDWISRLIPWVIWSQKSYEEESYSKTFNWKKEFPYYSRPPIYKWLKVPEILLSGNHKQITAWKQDNLKP